MSELPEKCPACEGFGFDKCVHTTKMRQKFDIQQMFFDRAVASLEARVASLEQRCERLTEMLAGMTPIYCGRICDPDDEAAEDQIQHTKRCIEAREALKEVSP